MLNDIVTLKAGLRVSVVYWKWCRLLDHIQLPIFSTIVSTIAPFLSYLVLNNNILKSGLGVTQGDWKRYHSKACVRFHIHLP